MNNIDEQRKHLETEEEKEFDVRKEIEKIKNTINYILDLIKTRNF